MDLCFDVILIIVSIVSVSQNFLINNLKLIYHVVAHFVAGASQIQIKKKSFSEG